MFNPILQDLSFSLDIANHKDDSKKIVLKRSRVQGESSESSEVSFDKAELKLQIEKRLLDKRSEVENGQAEISKLEELLAKFG